MKPIPIPRYTKLHNTFTAQIVGYADAIQNTAYGACVYLRVVDESGNVKVSLQCSKSRVNPIKQDLTVPRVELNAAVLLAKLVLRVHDTITLKLKIDEVILHSDSQIVIAWIKTSLAKLNVYVANRVKLIFELTSSFTWAYINTGENPADCLSRGVLMSWRSICYGVEWPTIIA
ncbi:pao retrotransposon peptidase domain-containing protein [Phthorimaea operculella]|nr:pao retrotransposon peptidase domain-containing protein [Phthorimaea operculella]